MRIAGARVRHEIVRDLSGGRIQLAYISAGIGSEPDVSIGITRQTMRSGILDVELELLNTSGCLIQPAQLIGEHAGVPKRSVWGNSGIVWPRVACGRLPFLDRHVDAG